MIKWSKIPAAVGLCLVCQAVLAEDVQLPAPVLQWSFYIFLLFALAVGIGIFFIRPRKKDSENLPDESGPGSGDGNQWPPR